MFAKRRAHMNIRLTVALAIATLLLAIAYTSTASAQSAAANTLRVTPVRTDIEILPGQSKTVPTTVTNLTGASITVRPTTNDFVSGDERGTPSLILDENQFAPSHSLKRFMGPLADVTIPANQSKTVNVVITVPADAKAGGYFGAVRFSPATPDSGGQVNTSASVASLILLTVPGDALENLQLTNFDVKQGGNAGPNFFDGKSLQVTSRFKNEGNLQAGPFGKITVKKGDAVVYEADFNNKNPRDMVLPGGARVWDLPIENVDGFGQYTVLATFTYGSKNQTIEAVKSFWVIPPFVIIGAIVALLVLVGIIIGLVVYFRGSKRKRSLPRGPKRI